MPSGPGGSAFRRPRLSPVRVAAAPETAPGRYDPVAIGLHWAVAALVAAVVALGLAVPAAPLGGSRRALILLLHGSIGLTVLATMAFQAWWHWRHPPPRLRPSLGPVTAFLARANHVVLYLLLLGMPVSGYVNAAAAGHSVSLFGIVAVPPLIGESGRLSQIAIALHLAGQFLVYLFVTLHIAAALIHRFVRDDGIFERMLPARRPR